jgi:twitching motility two-component system response regulator PilH
MTMLNIQNILIVDDSKTEQIHLSSLLRAEGYACQVANDGEDAMLKMAVVQPDLILMDVVMPGANGFQVTRTLTRNPQYANIPIIMCTSKDQLTDKMWGIRQGARGYLIKPIQRDDLLAAIAALDQPQAS